MHPFKVHKSGTRDAKTMTLTNSKQNHTIIFPQPFANFFWEQPKQTVQISSTLRNKQTDSRSKVSQGNNNL